MVFSMNLKKVMTTDVISLNIGGKTKEEVIKNLLDILVKTGKIKDPAKALEAILERERKMSTGMQNGIAIPHAKTDTVDQLIACIGISKNGIDFNSLDGAASSIFIMTLSPTDKTGPHIQFLAEIGRLLQDEEAREKVLNAKTPGEVLDIFVKG